MSARTGIANAFEHTNVPYGDDGKLVRGIIARCKYCPAAIALPVNCMSNSRGVDDEIEWKFIARKLEQKGWRIGRTRDSHLCPICFGKCRSAATRKSKEENTMTNSDANGIKNGVQVVQQNSRILTREDRRIIFEKLNEVYVDEKTGYGNGWTDEKVATNLGVPRAWVKQIRDENFGDEVANETIRAQIKEAHTVLTQINALRPEMARLTGLADKMMKQLDDIEKVMK
jgi:hypothetical protein